MHSKLFEYGNYLIRAYPNSDFLEMKLNSQKEMRAAILKTGDGWIFLICSFVFLGMLVRSIALNGFNIEQLRYIFFVGIVFSIFSGFRVINFNSELRTNTWGMINILGFLLFILFIEF